jgi:predicted nucleic acid-binding protein
LNAVLVDTSVSVDHFRNSTDAVIQLPSVDQVWIHPTVLGELACGTPPSRVQTLADLERLQQIQQANHREVLMFIEKERLFGVGCGLVGLWACGLVGLWACGHYLVGLHTDDARS